MKNITIWIIILNFLFCIGVQPQNNSVTFHYLGHSSFLIFFDDGTSILTDYGKPNAYLEYGWDSPIYDIGDFQPDICTYSHSHDDHYDSTRISPGNHVIVNKADTLIFKNLAIYPFLTSEKDLLIKDNRSYLFVYKGIKILHLGDCQANIMNVDSSENKNYIRDNIPLGCDVVLMPIESTNKFIPESKRFIDIIRPKMLIPMHYWSNEYKQKFLSYMNSGNSVHAPRYKVTVTGSSKYTYSKKTETDGTIQIISMKPSKFIDQ